MNVAFGAHRSNFPQSDHVSPEQEAKHVDVNIPPCDTGGHLVL